MEESSVYQNMRDLASLLLEEEQYEEALKILKQMVIEKSDDPSSWFELGICYSRMNRIAEARTAYKRSYELKEDPHTLMSLIYALETLGRKEEAKTYMEEYRKEYAEDLERVHADIFDTLYRCEVCGTLLDEECVYCPK